MPASLDQHRPESTEAPYMTELHIRDCINDTCPWSGKPVSPDSLTLYGGQVVGFCNPGCRDKFEKAMTHFENARARKQGAASRSTEGRTAAE